MNLFFFSLLKINILKQIVILLGNGKKLFNKIIGAVVDAAAVTAQYIGELSVRLFPPGVESP